MMSIGLVLFLFISSSQITAFASEDSEIIEPAVLETEQESIENEELIENEDIEEKEPGNQEADSHLEVTENEVVQSSLEESVEEERIVETVDNQRSVFRSVIISYFKECVRIDTKKTPLKSFLVVQVIYF